MSEKIISILHIASDEKFINGSIYIFEKAFPGSNHFVIPLSRFRKNFLYVRNAPNVEAVPYGRRVVERLLKNSEAYDCIILHGITELNSTAFLSSSVKEKFAGIIWGAELYRDDNYPDLDFLGKLTSAITLPKPATSFKEKTVNLLKGLIYKRSVGSRSAIRKTVSQLLYFCGLNEMFYEDLKERGLVLKKYKMIPFTYYPLEFIMKGNETLQIRANEIMVGNSASFTNNHLEAFNILKQLGIGSRKVVVPLSYGNSLYADHIEAAGNDTFTKQFQPLRQFMPLEEYNRVLQVCGIVIMNHYRSQAVGNIIAMLWMGSKVYLSESNVFYHHLKRIGIIVCSIEKDLVVNNIHALENLSQEEIEHNRDVLAHEFCEDSVVKKLRNGLLNIFHES